MSSAKQRERIDPLAELHARRLIFSGDQATALRFRALAEGDDAEGYLDACRVICAIGPETFNVLAAVVIYREPLRSPRGLELLRTALDALATYFATLDDQKVAA